MIIGFGFGSPLVALLMLIATSLLSYGLFRMIREVRESRRTPEDRREELRRWYYAQRDAARRMARDFDLTDEEIEEKIEEELSKRP